jgi:hypothetical protein
VKNLVTGTTHIAYSVMLPYLQTERICSRKSPSFRHEGNVRRSSSWSKYETMQSPSNIMRLSEFLDVISNTEHEEWFEEVEIPGCDPHSCRHPLLCLSWWSRSAGSSGALATPWRNCNYLSNPSLLMFCCGRIASEHTGPLWQQIFLFFGKAQVACVDDTKIGAKMWCMTKH